MAGKGTNPPSKARNTKPDRTFKGVADELNRRSDASAPRAVAPRPAPAPSGPPIPGWQPPNNAPNVAMANANAARLTAPSAPAQGSVPSGGTPRPLARGSVPSGGRAAASSLTSRVPLPGPVGLALSAAPLIADLIARHVEMRRPAMEARTEEAGRRGADAERMARYPNTQMNSMAEGRQAQRDYNDPFDNDETARLNMERERQSRSAAPPRRPAAPRQAAPAQPSMSDLLNRAQLSGEGRKFVLNDAPNISDEAELRRRLQGFTPDVNMSKGGMVNKYSKGGDVSGSFGDAFKRARAAGETEFTWNGGKYHTKTKEEVGGRSETVRPTAKPSAAARATAEAKRSGSTDDYVDTSKPIDRASAARETDRVSRGAVKMAKGGMVGCSPKKMAKGGLAGSFDIPGMSDTPGRAPQNRRPKTMKAGAKPKIKATMKAKNNMPLPKMARGGMAKKGK